MWVEGSHEHASEQRFLFGRSEQHPRARVVCARGCVRACGDDPTVAVYFCTPLRLAPSVSSGVLVRSTDTKLRNETRGTNAEIAISSKPTKKI